MAVNFDSEGFATSTCDVVFYQYRKHGDELIYHSGEHTTIFEGVALPPNVTLEAPPMTMDEGKSIFYIKDRDIWVTDYDYIGKTVYNKTTGETMTITNRGEIPNTYTLEKYPGKGYNWSSLENKWVMSEAYKKEKIFKDKTKQRQELLDKTFSLISKCNELISAKVNVDYFTGLKEGYQAKLKEIYEIDLNKNLEATLPEVEEFVL